MPLSDHQETLRQRNKDAAQNAGFFWVNLSNQSIAQLTLQLMAIAGILLPLSGSLISICVDLSIFEKVILLLIWFALLISIFFGLGQIVVDALYYRDFTVYNQKLTQIWSRTQDDFSIYQQNEQELTRPSSNSTFIPLISQVVFSLIAYLLLIALGFSILFL